MIIKNNGEFDIKNDYRINLVELKETEVEHTHRFIELVYTFHGSGIHKVDGKEYHVKSGDLLLINYHCCHTVIPVENLCYMDIMLKPEYVNETLRGTEDLFLILQLRDFSDLSNLVVRDNIFLHFDAEEQKRIELLLHWTAEEQKNNCPAGELVLRSALSMILCMVFRKMTENQNARLSVDDYLLLYIDCNCHNKLLIREIASMCGYTAEHFSRSFKAYTGKTPMQYITDAKINKAKELLLKTDKPIEVIYAECGFAGRTMFYKKFKESTGVTPLRYRKNQK